MGDKKVRRITPGEQADAVWVVGIGIENRGKTRGLERANQRRRIFRVAKGQKLHEEPAVGNLWCPVTDPAFFADIQFFIHGNQL